MGLFSIRGLVICEQYKMIIFNDVIHLLHAKRNREAFDMHKAIFGSLCPSDLLRGAGDTQQKRKAEQANMRESFKMVKDELDQFRFKFPEKFYVCSHDEKSDK